MPPEKMIVTNCSHCKLTIEVFPFEFDEAVRTGKPLFCSDKCRIRAESAEYFDPVNKPKHYADRKFEVIDVIEDNLSVEEFQGYLTGNILKYVSRYKGKGGVEDLRKAAWYIERLIRRLEE